jgi:uncharacterized membrane protein
MTDPIVPDPTPPTPPAAPAYAPAPTGTKQALSLTSFILGIVSVVLFITTWFAAIIGIVAVVLGFIARSREPGAPRWMALLGIILGFVGIIIAVIVIVIALAIVAAANNNR